MKQFTANAASQQVSAAGPRRFIHIQNLGAIDVFVKYDGDVAALTIANGVKIAPGDTWQLNNAPGLIVFDQAVHVITGGGNADLRIAGVDSTG